MSAVGLPQAKLRHPEPSGLVRPRLLEFATDAAGPTAVNLVVGPAGSGKTTLLAHVAATSEFPVCWYRVTDDDRDESRLIARLAQALRPFGVLPDADIHSTPEFLQSLDSWHGNGALLVLDDVHDIVGSAAERALIRCIDLRPPQLRFVLGSRRPPEMNVPRARASGTLREISGDELRFRSWEVEELFTRVYREPLRPEAAAALTRRTGGWAAGLQLFHLSTRGRGDAERHRAVGELAGHSRLVRSYLARNVLAELPATHRTFLLRTATLGRLTGPLCDHLLDTVGSVRTLDDFAHRQLFTSADEAGGGFRYHEVLQTHLELALVEEYGEQEAGRWYRRSAELLEEAGHPRDAIRAHAKGGDWDAVSRLIRQTAGGDPVDVDPAAAPFDRRSQDPWLALALARRQVRSGALTSAAQSYRRALTLLTDANYAQHCRDELATVRLWLPDQAPSPSLPSHSGHWAAALLLAGDHGRARTALRSIAETTA